MIEFRKHKKPHKPIIWIYTYDIFSILVVLLKPLRDYHGGMKYILPQNISFVTLTMSDQASLLNDAPSTFFGKSIVTTLIRINWQFPFKVKHSFLYELMAT